MSRLDRLLSLLETGSSAVTRKAAALQLGEVQRLHPHELHNLLTSVAKYLRHPAWETRIAAGQAVEAILTHVPPWKPIGASPEDIDGEMQVDTEEGRKLSLKSFDFETISTKSAHLMGSEGKEYDAEIIKKEETASLEKQRETLNAKLGLEMCSKLGINTDNLYTSEDLKITIVEQNHSEKMNVSEVVGLSMREMNRARRKAKQALMRQRSATSSCQDSDGTQFDQPDKKRIKLEHQSSVGPSDNLPSDSLPTPDNTGYWPPEAIVWPVEWFCERLLSDLFSPSWEVRHGAATALRHLIKTHGSDGGRAANIQQADMSSAHQGWLEDVALRLVCVLTLDRFGDFISDQVVAPVRETCAQALGSVTLHMSESGVVDLVKILLKLLKHADWETRHGGLLGIKYTFAARQEMLEKLLSLCLDGLHSALKDKVDDVGAVAGAALSLAVGPLTQLYPERAMSVFHTLATHIPELDDLTPAANTFVPLVVQLLNHKHISSQLSVSDEVEKLVQRVWSLLEHNNSSVRKAALETLSALPAYNDVELLKCSLKHIFQRALFEHCPSVIAIIKQVWCDVINKSDLSEVLLAACPSMTHWLCLAMQPARLPFESALLLRAKQLNKDGKSRVACGDSQDIGSEFKVTELKMYIGGNETIPADQRESNALSARYLTSQMLGYLSKLIVQPDPGAVYRNKGESPVAIYVKVLLVYFESKSSLQRFIAGLVIGEWASLAPPSPPPSLLVNKLNECLNETIYYDEIALAFTKLLQDTKDFLALMKHYEVPNIDHVLAQEVLTFDQMLFVCGDEMSKIINKAKLKAKVLKILEDRRLALSNAITTCHSEYTALNVMTLSSMAGGLLHLGELPEKPGHLVKPLMDCIKKEENHQLQDLGARNVAKLIEVCLERNPSTVSKIITNLCNYLRCDTEFTPQVQPPTTSNNIKVELPTSPTNNVKTKGGKNNRNGEKIKKHEDDIYNGIHTLTKQQQNAERALLRRCNSNSGRGPGRPPLIAAPVAAEPQAPTPESNLKQKQNEIQRRGATMALVAIVKRFGTTLPDKLPQLWKSVVGQLMQSIVPSNYSPSKLSDAAAGNELIGLLLVLEITAPDIHPDLFPKLLESFDCLVCLLYHNLSAVRHMASRCIASLSTQDVRRVLTLVIKKVLPLLGVSENVTKRQGAMETIYTLMEKMQLSLVPYIIFLVIPVMGRMSDQDISVRTLATNTFARLIQLMPLDGGKEDKGLSKDLLELKSSQRTFLEQLFNPTQIEDYKVPIPISAQLRSYQQSGVNWLSFLNKYKLHGILCDDMGLGKTIQSICILAGDHYDRQKKYKETGDSECAPLPSLVVCPPTLTGHWVFEVDKFLSKKYLNPLQFVGTPGERERLRSRVKHHNLVVASYDIVRKDVAFFSSIKWNYCILDEGHIIKNGKTKSTQAIKMLKANHRLILSGTPIQNNVLELWSLFDFLMPGFLGTEKQFTCRYSRPILASRDPKSTPREQEAGVLAMEALHRQVLPFVLRRIKEDVLKELPPKITQDYYCELSPLQKQLYEDFTKSQAHQSLADNINSKQHNQAHIFQALRYMQSVCNHPKLALTPKHPQYDVIKAQLLAQNSNLSDIQHAAKLPALKQLLNDCGIGVESEGGQEGDLVVNQHRALIFCQLKTMLNILENDFFKVHMPRVSYLRLDGSVPASSRNAVVTTFNNDPSIDVLLLTTQVGGLGLNLTGADTVIFIEHDWSPMRDLQAMDRAHRIGQKKVVNVYRLITKATLEEKIMGLQKFKLMTANTVISSENASLETMGTDKLLDLFSMKGEEDKGGDKARSGGSGAGSLSSKSFIESLPSLWDHKDYDTEYDINNFINSLRPAPH